MTRELPPPPPPPPPPGQRIKLMPDAVAKRVYAEYRAIYNKLQSDVAKVAGNVIVDPEAALAQVGAPAHAGALVGVFKPALVRISGCQDNQTSMDGDHNGAFTEKLLQVWNHGTCTGDHHAFHWRIRAALPSSQSPNLFVLGPVAPFLTQVPFTV